MVQKDAKKIKNMFNSDDDDEDSDDDGLFSKKTKK